TLIDEIKLENYIHYIRRIGNYLYVSKNDTILNIYDIHTADSITLINQLFGTYSGYPWRDVFIEGDSIIISNRYGRQYFINDTVNLTYIRNIGLDNQIAKSGIYAAGCEETYVDVCDIDSGGSVTGPSDGIVTTEEVRGIILKHPYVYFGYGSKGIGILDINDLYNIIEKSNYITNGYTYDIELIEDTIMIAARGLNGIGIYDIDNDTIFTLIGECNTDGYTYELEVIGDRLYVGARSGGLQIIDISNKSNPVLLGEYKGYGECRRIDIEGDRLYVASGDGGLMIMDISTRTDPTVISQCYSRHIAEDVVKQGNYVYMADGDSGLTVMDIIDENNPSIEGELITGYYQKQIDNYNDIVVLSNNSTDPTGLPIIDVSNPSSPVKANEVMTGCNKFSIMLDSIYLHANAGGGTQPRYRIIDLTDMYVPVYRDSVFQLFSSYGGIYVKDNKSYMCYEDTFYCYDVSDMNNIIEINRRERSGFTSLVRMKNDTLIDYVEGGNRMFLWDYTDPYNPDSLLITKCKYHAYDIYILGEYMYVTQGEFSLGQLNKGKYGLSIYGFNVSGIENKQIFTKQENITITTTFNSININNQTGIPQYYTLTDITGRIINTIKAKSGITELRPKKSGVYFIVDKDSIMRKKFIIIR
ncbi:hypothetical protein KAU15_03830, partial [candidate division WOR-3 bacterium]|nr:hypothetical protein [candidate division WOR-3 bacterium]